MKPLCRVLTATALLVPAFFITSCDDKDATPVGPSDDPAISGIGSPSFTTVGFGSKWHDPHIKGPKVRVFTNNPSGAELCQTDAKRFKSEDGAELRVALPEIIAPGSQVTALEDLCDAGVYPVDQKIRGKLLTAVKELDFSYAGGDENGAPRMRIPIDCGVEVTGVTEECTTDGTMEQYAYIDARTCNDGDANVGVVNAEDKAYCEVGYGGYYYDSWEEFVDAHPNARVARKVYDEFSNELVDARTSVVLSPIFQLFLPGSPTQGPLELSPHYLVWMVDVR